jgi:hypothetical protein
MDGPVIDEESFRRKCGEFAASMEFDSGTDATCLVQFGLLGQD